MKGLKIADHIAGLMSPKGKDQGKKGDHTASSEKAATAKALEGSPLEEATEPKVEGDEHQLSEDEHIAKIDHHLTKLKVLQAGRKS